MFRLLRLAAALLCLAPLSAQAPQGQSAELPSAARQKVMNACFEIVVPKPEERGITYEKELPWDLVPYHIRTDAYISIGTAFAISKTELVTAFHVLDLLRPSLTYQKCYLRDRDKRVYEVDQILASHEQKDVVRFTVKGRTFDTWLGFQSAFSVNLPVWTAGNAFGEGIVIRKGDILGTIPEEMDGQFEFIKSSADVNGGNSGGPLVDQNGDVVGVVLRKRDNVSYSLPSAQFLNLAPGEAVYRNKVTYSFALLPSPSGPQNRNAIFTLPMAYEELRAKVKGAFFQTYQQQMGELFAANGLDAFPGNAVGDEAIHDFPTRWNLEVAFKDQGSGRWCFTAFDYKTHDFGLNGRLHIASANDITFARIRKPDDMELGTLQTSPKLLMDCFFKALNIPRNLAGQKVRITSLGDPARTRRITDRQGRPWDVNVWSLAFEDQVAIVMSTPIPTGVAMLVKFTNSASMEDWSFDLTRMLDFVYVSYHGKLKDWQGFLAHPQRLPQALKGLKVTFAAGKELRVDAPWLTARLPQSQLEISPETGLGFNLGFFPGPSGNWVDFRRLILDEDDTENYFVLVKHLRAGEDSPTADMKSWKEVARQRHPYTQRSFFEDGRTNIAAVHPGPKDAEGPLDQRPALFTLYLGREGSVDDPEMKKRLASILKAITVLPQTAPAPTAGTP